MAEVEIKQYMYTRLWKISVNLQTAVMLVRAYARGRASQVGLQDRPICYSECTLEHSGSI